MAGSARRDALRDALEDDLRVVIEIRNKLAHGQWIYPFNSAGTDVEHEKFLLINRENLLSLHCKFDVVGHLADAVHDLVVSPPAFERDFERHFKQLSHARTRLTTLSYDKYREGLIASRAKARAATPST